MRYIYTLSDPNGEIRYVGVSKHPKIRFTEHLNQKSLKRLTYKDRWLAGLFRVGRKPSMQIIFSIEDAYWKDCEKFWIQEFRNRGCKLTNTTSGGDGALGSKRTQKTKDLIAASNRRRTITDKTRNKMSLTKLQNVDFIKNHAKILYKLSPNVQFGFKQPKEQIENRIKSRRANHKLKIDLLRFQILDLYFKEELSKSNICKILHIEPRVVREEIRKAKYGNE